MSDRIHALKSFISDDPDDPFLAYALALEYKSLGDIKNAYTSMLDVITRFPDYLPSYYMCGQLAEQNNIKAEALDFYRNGISIAKKNNDRHALNELQAALNSLQDEMEIE